MLLHQSVYFCSFYIAAGDEHDQFPLFEKGIDKRSFDQQSPLTFFDLFFVDAPVVGKKDVPGLEYSDILSRYEKYMGWIAEPTVLSLRFEELILDRNTALESILDYLSERGFAPRVSRPEAVQILKDSIQPKKSGTYRKGQPGGWKKAFTAENIKVFKQITGDLLVRLGYEQNNNW